MQTETQNQESNKIFASPKQTIPERDILCGRNLLNLDSFYTESLDDDIHHKPGNTLSDLPKGLQNIGSIDFDIRGVVQLAGHRSEEITTLVYPKTVSSIPVNMKGGVIHFLHASAWNIDSNQVLIGKYHINYEEGRMEEINLIYRANIWDWWSSENDGDLAPVWKGYNKRTTAIDQHIRLFMLSWENPLPKINILSIDLISTCLGPGPMIAGVTLT